MPGMSAVRPAKKSDRAALVSLPIIDIPFSRIAMDIVGPLERSMSGIRYILVIADYANLHIIQKFFHSETSSQGRCEKLAVLS